MARFRYAGIDQSGSSETGEIEAGDRATAFETLKSRGVAAFELEALDGTSANWGKSRWRSGNWVSVRDHADLADLLALLYETGLTTPEVVRHISETAANPEIRRIFQASQPRIADGSDLSVALNDLRSGLTPGFLTFTAVADRSNSHATVMRSAALFFRRRATLQQKLNSALVYPTILLCVSLALVALMIFFLAPTLATVFESTNAELPQTLSALLVLGEIARSPFFSIALIILLLGVLIWLRRRGASTTLSWIPGLGRVAKLGALNQNLEAVRLLLKSGEPLPNALKTAAATSLEQSPITRALEAAADALDQGHRAAPAIAAEPQIPANIRALFQLGEETNRMPEILDAACLALDTEIETAIERWLSLVTPVITLILGLGIGALIYVLLGALLDVNQLAL